MKERIKLGTKILSLLLVLSLVISILPMQASAENEPQVTPQTYGEWTDVVPVNGSFEVGVEGMDVYGWSITSIDIGLNGEKIADSESSANSYASHYTLKTYVEDTNKVAAFSKNENGHAAMTSQAIPVTGGTGYRLSYNYKTIDIHRYENTTITRDWTDNDIWGIRVAVRQLNDAGEVVAWDVLDDLGAHNGRGSEVMENWETVVQDFVAIDGATSAEIYFMTGGIADLRTTIWFDNISLNAYDDYEVVNGDFKAGNYTDVTGDVCTVADLRNTVSGWSQVSCNADDNYKVVDSGNHLDNKKRYVALVTADGDRDSVLKYTTNSKNQAKGAAMIQSPYIPVEANTEYTLNYDLKCVADASAYKADLTTLVNDTQVIVSYYDSKYSLIEFSQHNKVDITENIDWTSKSISPIVPGNTAYIKIGFTIRGGWYQSDEQMEIYVDNVSLSYSNSTSIQGWYSGTAEESPYKYKSGSVNSGVHVVSYAGIDGKGAICFKKTDANWTYGQLLSSKYDMSEGGTYQVSYDFLMTDFDQRTSKNKGGGMCKPRAFVQFYGEEDNYIGFQFLTPDINPVDNKFLYVDHTLESTSWEKANYTFDVMEGAKYGVVCLQLEAYDEIIKSTLYIDNFKIKPVVENADATDLLFVMLEGGNATGDKDGVVDVCDLVHMKKELADTQNVVDTNDSADMNKNTKFDTDDIKLLCWKLVGITKTEEIKTP